MPCSSEIPMSVCFEQIEQFRSDCEARIKRDLREKLRKYGETLGEYELKTYDCRRYDHRFTFQS